MGLKHFYISNQYAQELSCRQKFLAANRINFSNEFIRVKARLIFDYYCPLKFSALYTN